MSSVFEGKGSALQSTAAELLLLEPALPWVLLLEPAEPLVVVLEPEPEAPRPLLGLFPVLGNVMLVLPAEPLLLVRDDEAAGGSDAQPRIQTPPASAQRNAPFLFISRFPHLAPECFDIAPAGATPRRSGPVARTVGGRVAHRVKLRERGVHFWGR
jgi:hypothetical protein